MPLIVSCTAALTLLSHSVSYITFLFSESRIMCITQLLKVKPSIGQNSFMVDLMDLHD